MHKQEASYLFSILSNGERVKILKFLYNNKIVYTFDMIKAFVDLNEEELKEILKPEKMTQPMREKVMKAVS